jgi:hypothetical protein
MSMPSLAAGGLVQAEQAQRLHQVEMRLAGGDNAEPRILAMTVDAPVDRIGFGKGEHGVLLDLHPLLDLRAGQIGPAVVQPAGRHRRSRGSRESAIRQESTEKRRPPRFPRSP